MGKGEYLQLEKIWLCMLGTKTVYVALHSSMQIEPIAEYMYKYGVK